jgi:Rhodopirellula transposase DDE domain
MSQEEMIARLREKFTVLDAVLDERGRRLWAVTEAKALGHGGQTRVAKATGLSRRTIYQGLREIKHLSGGHQTATQRVRSPGGGRKALTDHDPTLLADLEALVEPPSRGDPEAPWRWTCKSGRQLAAELQRHGHQVGRQKVAALLAALASSLQGNRKTKEGTAHPDRNAQFAHINQQFPASRVFCSFTTRPDVQSHI